MGFPILSSYHPHPALPLPRHKDGGIFDKGEGVKNVILVVYDQVTGYALPVYWGCKVLYLRFL